MKTKLFPILLALLLFLCGCAAEEELPAAPVDTDFAAAGMHITLTDEFIEKPHVAYTALYESAELAVMVLKEEYTLFENTDFSAQTSPEQYAELVWRSNKMVGAVPLEETDGLTWFEYSQITNGTHYTYRSYVMKSNEAFWLFQFAVRSENYPTLSDTIHKYAMSVYFDNPYLSTLPEIQY